MNYLKILNLLSLVIPAFIAGTKKVVKGNEKYLIAIAAYFVLKRFAETAGKNEVRDAIQTPGGNNPNSNAQLYRHAMNPTGYKWLMDIDGTDEEMLFDLARSTVPFQQTAIAYKTLFETDLTEDLRKELSPADFQKFMKIVNRLV